MAWVLFMILVGIVDYAAANTLVDADAAFSRGEYGVAVKLYTAVIDQDPGSPLLYTKRAAAYIVLRQQSQALRDLNKAIEVDATFLQGFMNRGKLQRQMCNLGAAERDFNSILEIKKDHKAAIKEMAETQRVRDLLSGAEAEFEAQNVDAALASLDKLFEVAQDCMAGLLLQARLFMAEWPSDWAHPPEVGPKYEEVVATTGRLLKSDPGNLEALVLRGRAYFRLNDHDLAKRHFGEALKYEPDCTAASKAFRLVKDYDKKRQRGDTAAAESDWAGAEMHYSEALRVDPEHRVSNAALWFGLCQAKHNLGREDAMDSCNNVLILDPNHVAAMVLLVNMLLEKEQWQEAVTKAREFNSRQQGNHELHSLLQEAEKRLKMSLRKDHYKTLGVDRTASDRDIKKAYREMAKLYHPDKVSVEDRASSEIKFRQVAEAYEVLSDEERRGRFDRGEDDQMQQQQQQQGHPFFHQGQGFQQTFHFQWG